MMRNLIQIVESFDSTVPYEFNDLSNEDVNLQVAEFNIGDGYFRVIFKRPYYNNTWEISFTRNGEFDLTKTGSAYTVMSTVTKIISDFIKKFDPRMFHFNAKTHEKSRLKLYPKLVKVLSKQFSEYTTNVKTTKRCQTHTMLRPMREFVPPPHVEDIEKSDPVKDQKLIDAFFARHGDDELLRDLLS